MNIKFSGHTTSYPLTHNRRLDTDNTSHAMAVIGMYYDIHNVYVDNVRISIDRRQSTAKNVQKIKAYLLVMG